MFGLRWCEDCDVYLTKRGEHIRWKKSPIQSNPVNEMNHESSTIAVGKPGTEERGRANASFLFVT